jgi:predicted phosphodiesterase
MGHIRQFRDPKISLWQSAVDEVVASKSATAQAQSFGIAKVTPQRPTTDDPMIHAAAVFAAASESGRPIAGAPAGGPPVAEGISDVARHCSNVALKLAEALGKAILGADPNEIKQYQDQLGKFTTCDSRYAEAAKKYAEYFVLQHKNIPYRRYQEITDFVIKDVMKFPNQARVAIVGDWGTGQDDAKEVLRQIVDKKPHVIIHLGDIYYSGTQFEVDNYFYAPWKQIALASNPDLLTFSLSGNHDMYCGGQPYYNLIDKLGQPASYFCLRNDNWQFIAIDTGLHDCNPIGAEPPILESSEKDWIVDKIQNGNPGRTVLLSHHQLYSAYDGLSGKGINEHLSGQLQDVLNEVAVWIWGHEHNLVIYKKQLGVLGRCVGHGAFPVAFDEIPDPPPFPGIAAEPVRLSRGFAFYRHGYAIMELDGPSAQVSYFEDLSPDKPLFRETL